MSRFVSRFVEALFLRAVLFLQELRDTKDALRLWSHHHEFVAEYFTPPATRRAAGLWLS